MKGADSTMTKQLTTINPATEEVINTYDVATKEQIKEKPRKLRMRTVIGKKIYIKELTIFMISLKN
jgi:acyl-CoA reductase-like NAD-dependent aldehyde dehydrogenase